MQDLEFKLLGCQNCLQCVLIMKVGDASSSANNCVTDPFDGPKKFESFFVQDGDQNVLHVGVWVQQAPGEYEKNNSLRNLVFNETGSEH